MAARFRQRANLATWDIADSLAAERLYRRSGIPNLIEGYAATTDILTRLSPFLMIWFFLNVATATATATGDAVAARTLGAIVVGVSVTVAINAYYQVRAGRRWWSLPRRIGWLQLALWFLIPAVLAMTFGDDSWTQVLAVAANNAGILAFVVFLSAFGIWSMIRWAFSQIRTHAWSMTDVLLKTLPVMLLTTLFFFFTGETWQLMHNLAPQRFAGGLAAFWIFESLILLSSVARATANMGRFASWSEMAVAATEAGATNIGELPTDAPEHKSLPRRVRFNIGLVVFFTQALQATIVFFVVAFALVCVGILFVRPATVKMWVTEQPHYLFESKGLRDKFMEVITAEMVKVSLFIGAFSSLMFSVGLSNASTETVNAEDVTVLRDSVQHVREAIAVRRLREHFGFYDQDQVKGRRRRKRAVTADAVNANANAVSDSASQPDVQ